MTIREQAVTGRGAVAVVIAVLSLLALTGCVKADLDITVNRDDTVSGTMLIAFDKSTIERFGGDTDPLGDAPITGVTGQRPYDDGTYEGTEYVFENTPLSEFNDYEASGDYLRIEREKDGYVLDGLLSAYTAPDEGPVDPGLAEAFERAEIRVSVTFPGAVSDTNGELSDGDHTVTWHLSLTERNELHATAGLGSDGRLALWVLWISLALVALVALLLAIRLRRVSLGRR